MSKEPTEISFAEAYEELKAITERLNREEVEADELVELLRRGKGLEAALREHLTNIEQEVKEIESGEGIAAYRITRAAAADEETEVVAAGGDFEVPADTSDFGTDPAPASIPSKEDIPF